MNFIYSRKGEMPLLLGSATQTSPGVSLFAPASGGGGGGGGPNPSVSTLTVANGGGIVMAQTSAINMPYDSGNGGIIAWSVDDGSTYVAQQQYPAQGMGPASLSSIGGGPKVSLIRNDGTFDGFQVGAVIFDGNGQGSSALCPAMASDAAANLSIWASNVNISSLTVSSINGATPGGGGSVPADLTVSSISSITGTFSTSISITGDGGSAADGGLIWPGAGGVGNSRGIGLNGITGGGFVLSAFQTDPNLSVSAGAGDFGANKIYFLSGAAPDSSTYIQNGNDNQSANGALNIVCPLGVNISSLNVSSINGAAPGGGSISPDLSVSTLTVDGTGFITLNQGAVLGTQDDLVIQSDKSATATARFWTSTTTFTAEGSNANNLAIYNAGASPITDSLNLISQEGGPAVIRCDSGVRFQAPSVAVSSFTVSSVNGAAYPPAAGAYPKVSTIGLGGGGVQTLYSNISTGSLAQFTDTFGIEIGHLYQLSWNYSVVPSATATYGEHGIFAPASAVLGVPRTVYQDLGISTVSQNSVVLAGQGNGTAYMTFTTNTTAPVDLDMLYNTTNVELIDFGPIATSF
jgi:hypothetical protein